jgi:hypothetical protein
MPISFADCSTTDQIAQSPSSSPINFPLLESDRSNRPSSTFAATIQASIPCLTQIGAHDAPIVSSAEHNPPDFCAALQAGPNGMYRKRRQRQFMKRNTSSII